MGLIADTNTDRVMSTNMHVLSRAEAIRPLHEQVPCARRLFMVSACAKSWMRNEEVPIIWAVKLTAPRGFLTGAVSFGCHWG